MGYSKNRPFVKVDVTGEVDKRFDEVTSRLAQTSELMLDRMNTSTQQVTSDNDKYQAWPQDKAYTYGNDLYMMFNEGNNHISSDLKVKRYVSKDGGKTWEDNGTLYEATGYSGGATCWAAGVDIRFYMIVRLRGTSYDVGTSVHKLVYGIIGNGVMPTTMAEKDINISKSGKVPIMYHSFASLPDGSIAFGYQYMDGEVGIAKTFDLGDTWTTHIIYTSSQMGGSILLVEPSLYYDSQNNRVVGFLRSQNIYTRKPEFFVSADNCQTFTTYSTDISVSESPIPIKKMGDKYYAMSNQRTGEGAITLYEGNVDDVLSNGWSAFSSVPIGKANYAGIESSSGTGAGSIAVLDNNLHLFYGSEEVTGKPNIYQTIITSKPTILDKINLNDSHLSSLNKKETGVSAYANSGITCLASENTVMSFPLKSKDNLKELQTDGKTITFKEKGNYSIHPYLYINAVATEITLKLYKNGVVFKRLSQEKYTNAVPRSIKGGIITHFDKGDQIQIVVYTQADLTTRGGGQALNYLEIFRVS